MGDKIMEQLTLDLAMLMRELAMTPGLKNVFASSTDLIRNDEGKIYECSMTFKDDTGRLCVEYQDETDGFAENTFKFQLKKNLPMQSASGYSLSQQSLAHWLEQEDISCELDYNENDGAWIHVTAFLVKSWKGPAANRQEEMLECVKEAWRVLEKWEAMAEAVH